jgi:hypothetical protein
MAGRAQAANLTGMLNQLAETVGTMGEASDWTHQNIRDYSAPDIKDGSYESLSAYANWAQRNGKQEVADKYRALALAQQQKSKKGAYAQSLAKRRDQIRNLDKGIGALTATIAGMPETTTTMVDAPAPKPDVGGPRRPFQAADNGGFRRPPVAPEAREQIAQEQANPNRAVLNKRLNDMQAELTNRYAALNKFGDENLQFGGLGTEGSEFERTLASEKAAAKSAALSNAQAEVTYARGVTGLKADQEAAAIRAEKPIWQKAEVGYQDGISSLMGEIDQLENIRSQITPDDTRYEAITKMINSKISQRDSLAGQYQEAGVSSIAATGQESDAFVQKERDRINEARREQASKIANQRAEEQAAQKSAGIAEAQRLIGLGYKEIPATVRATMHPLAVAEADSTMTTHRASTDRIEKAFDDGYVSPEDIAYAENLGSENAVINAALTAYNKEIANPITTGLRNQAAKKLSAAVESHRATQSTAREDVLIRQSIGEYARLFKGAESWTDSPFNDDVMDGITEENRETFYAGIEQVMVGEGVNQIKSVEEFYNYAVVARDQMGLNTDTANMAAVLDQVGTDDLVQRSATNLFNESLKKIKSEFPELSNSAQNRKAKEMSSKLGQNFKILFMGQNTDQIHWLNQAYSKDSPPWMHQLFDNDPESIKAAVDWLREDPGNRINFKNFESLSQGETPNA